MTSRVPIGAADVSRMIEEMGCDNVIALDLHAGQIQGFFSPHVPVENLSATNVGAVFYAENRQLSNPVVVSPDAGGT
jgi:ribose-phosphate pyrophosphokinase